MSVAAIVMLWNAGGSRGVAKSSIKQIEEMVRPSLSLIPKDYLMRGDFSTLVLQNTGGVAKDVYIDITIADSGEKQLLFAPAIDKDHVVLLPREVTEARKTNGTIKVNVEMLDSHGRNYTEKLLVDFGKLTREGRNLAFVGSTMFTPSEPMKIRLIN